MEALTFQEFIVKRQNCNFPNFPDCCCDCCSQLTQNSVNGAVSSVERRVRWWCWRFLPQRASQYTILNPLSLAGNERPFIFASHLGERMIRFHFMKSYPFAFKCSPSLWDPFFPLLVLIAVFAWKHNNDAACFYYISPVSYTHLTLPTKRIV